MTEWIKCSDRLPEDCVNVLIFCPLIKQMTAAYLAYSVDREPLFYCIIDFDEYDQNASIEDITHWMPLPNPPQEF